MLPLCCKEEQCKFVEILDKKMSVITKAEKILTTILFSQARRQFILEKAFSGQLVPQDIKDVSTRELLN